MSNFLAGSDSAINTRSAMTNKLTVPALKKFHARPDIKSAIALVKTARADYARIRAHVDSYVDPTLAQYEFTSEDTGERITRAKDLYLIPESQEEQCKAWYAHVDRLHVEHGYTGLEPGQCPALVAEMKAIRAENALLKEIEAFLEVEVGSIRESAIKAIDSLSNFLAR